MPGNTDNEFNQDAQNTHDRSVTLTVRASLQALNRRYGQGLNEVACIEEIGCLVHQEFNYSNILCDSSANTKRREARDFLVLLEGRYNAEHSHTGYTIIRILSLVWMGIKDDSLNAFPEEMRQTCQTDSGRAKPEIIVLKKESLIEKFIDAARVYDTTGSICTGGAIHKLIEALNYAHTDVVIATGAHTVLPAANAMSLAIVGQALREETPVTQSRLLSDWDEDTAAVQAFRKSVTHRIRGGLRQHFGELLRQRDIDNILFGLPDMPRPPAPHQRLNQLVTEITNTLQVTGSPERRAGITTLHHRARGIYLKEFFSDEVKYQVLNLDYQWFLYMEHLNRFLTEIQDAEHVDKLNQFIHAISEAKITFDGAQPENPWVVDMYALSQQFNDTVLREIDSLKSVLAYEPGLWRNIINPILKGILGVLSALLIIPGVVVQCTAQNGFIGTFFKKPDTESMEALKAQSLDSIPQLQLAQ